MISHEIIDPLRHCLYCYDFINSSYRNLVNPAGVYYSAKGFYKPRKNGEARGTRMCSHLILTLGSSDFWH